MSEIEAKYDGIPRIYHPEIGSSGHMGTYMYHIPCEKCGDIILKSRYRREVNYLCDYCKGLIKKKTKLFIVKEILETKTKAEIRFEKAIEKIKEQVDDFDDYGKSIEIARKRTEKYGSIPEAMVAIELIHIGFKIIPQQQIKQYRVDFVIPTYKIVLEIDGKIFHQNDRQKDREAEIQMTLGFQWKILHIPAEMIQEDITKLKQSIKVLYNAKP